MSQFEITIRHTEIHALCLVESISRCVSGSRMVFVEAQLRLKMESPAARTFVANMSNGYAGYVPTARALERGGYETWTSSNSKLVPEALDMIVDSSVELLDGLFA